MSTGVPYRLASAPGKNLGLFATAPIHTGELIISELPIFTALSPSSIDRAVSALSSTDKETFFGLTDAYSPSSPTAQTIFKTNAIPLGLQPARRGIFPFICRINHSCSPNVRHVWCTAKNQETIYSSKDTDEGEEICTAYTEHWRSRSNRQKKLQADFHFTCKCDVCSGPINEVSDTRRERIAELDDFILHYTIHSPATGLRYAKERLRLMDEEGMYDLSERSKTHYDAFQACIACSQNDMAKRHMGLAYAYRLLCEGPDGDSTPRHFELYRHPLRHPAAGMLGQRTLPEICDGCGKDVGSGKKAKGGGCGVCHCAKYCSKDCKEANREAHRVVCEVLKAM